MTVCSMTRSKVNVTSPRKSEIRPFSKAISSPLALFYLEKSLTVQTNKNSKRYIRTVPIGIVDNKVDVVM